MSIVYWRVPSPTAHRYHSTAAKRPVHRALTLYAQVEASVDAWTSRRWGTTPCCRLDCYSLRCFFSWLALHLQRQDALMGGHLRGRCPRGGDLRSTDSFSSPARSRCTCQIAGLLQNAGGGGGAIRRGAAGLMRRNYSKKNRYGFGVRVVHVLLRRRSGPQGLLFLVGSVVAGLGRRSIA